MSSHSVCISAQCLVAHTVRSHRCYRTNDLVQYYFDPLRVHGLTHIKCVLMFPFFKLLTCSFSLTLYSWLLSHFLVPRGVGVTELGGLAREGGGERDGVESRTHEILKSFLGSPHHQHMLLSSLVHCLFFCLGSSSYYSSHSWCQSSFHTHSDSVSFIHLFTHSFILKTKKKNSTLTQTALCLLLEQIVLFT